MIATSPTRKSATKNTARTIPRIKSTTLSQPVGSPEFGLGDGSVRVRLAAPTVRFV